MPVDGNTERAYSLSPTLPTFFVATFPLPGNFNLTVCVADSVIYFMAGPVTGGTAYLGGLDLDINRIVTADIFSLYDAYCLDMDDGFTVRSTVPLQPTASGDFVLGDDSAEFTVNGNGYTSSLADGSYTCQVSLPSADWTAAIGRLSISTRPRPSSVAAPSRRPILKHIAAWGRWH